SGTGSVSDLSFGSASFQSQLTHCQGSGRSRSPFCICRHGRSFTGRLLDRWEINACPMSSAMLADSAAGVVVAAWETQGQVYFASQSDKTPNAATGAAGKNRHPALAVNARGESLLVWTEGIGWKRGGTLAYAQGQPLGERGTAQGIAVWSFEAVIEEIDNCFTILY
ncbi:MAG: hypothetical protein HOP19_21680, partial [Acidobacteria bacterium]|nr:hypothetical protein [Acidobacteriota bacterium]